ncbi:MAG: hypothetical protein ACPGAO_07530 [Flavobacteriaceae bacterium]
MSSIFGSSTSGRTSDSTRGGISFSLGALDGTGTSVGGFIAVSMPSIH